MSRTLRFASWNIRYSSAVKLQRQIDFLHTLHCDAVALQEVSSAGGLLLGEASGFARCLRSLDLRPREHNETTARDRGCVLLTSERLRLLSPADLLWDAAAPERTLVAQFDFEGVELSLASFHQVAASDRKWGTAKKRQTFDAICQWLRGHPSGTVAGMDVNSPKFDHPDISKNEDYSRGGVEV
jgi:hypothetical protein